MQVMVLKENVTAGDQANVSIAVAAHVHPAITVVSQVKFLRHLEQHAPLALNETVQAECRLCFAQFKNQCVTEAHYEGVFAQSAVVNVSVVVP